MAVKEQLARWFDFGIQVDNNYDFYQGSWASAETYSIGDIVINSSTYYYALQGHTASSSDEPGTGEDWEDYWESLGDTGFADIGGLTSFSPSTEKNDTETTTFDDNGWLGHLVSSRGLGFDLEGYHEEDSSTGARDAGQAILENLAEKSGPSAREDFRLTTPSGTIIQFAVSVDAPFKGMSTGGGNDDAAGWSATLTMDGEPTTV